MANDPEQKDPSAPSESDSSAAKPPAAQGDAAPKPPAAPAAPAAKPPAAAAPPRPPAPPKEGPVPLDNDLVKRYKERFGPAIAEAWVDRKQAILVIAAESLREIALYSRDEEKFDWLSDLTAVDWPKREKRFDLVLNLYSMQTNERLRLKVRLSEHEAASTVSDVWSTANWMEREVYDMFGISFLGHPELKRILLPE